MVRVASLKSILILFVPWNIMRLKEDEQMQYMSASQAAEKWKITQRRVQILCSENRIEGAFKVGEVWAIPENAKKPEDMRYKKNYRGEEKKLND